MTGEPGHRDVVGRGTQTVPEHVRVEPRRELVDALGCSRSTVERALRSLENGGVATYRNGEWHATFLGRFLDRRFRAYRSEVADAASAAPVLESLPRDSEMPPAYVSGADAWTGTPAVPDRPLTPVFESLRRAERIRAVVPRALAGAIDRFHEHATDGETYDVSVVVSPAVWGELDCLDAFDRAPVLTDPDLDLYRGPVSTTYTLWIADETEMGVIVHTSTGVSGVLRNEHEDAVRAALNEFQSVKCEADRIDASATSTGSMNDDR
ncbi:hypothetical protein [Halorubrum tibetense]|uniref:Transcriptional regulator n=1 Tax=Halorubrum tibetense TaxID=175631 RepID=A0ABD5S888_9EURY